MDCHESMRRAMKYGYGNEDEGLFVAEKIEQWAWVIVHGDYLFDDSCGAFVHKDDAKSAELDVKRVFEVAEIIEREGLYEFQHRRYEKIRMYEGGIFKGLNDGFGDENE